MAIIPTISMAIWVIGAVLTVTLSEEMHKCRHNIPHRKLRIAKEIIFSFMFSWLRLLLLLLDCRLELPPKRLT